MISTSNDSYSKFRNNYLAVYLTVMGNYKSTSSSTCLFLLLLHL